MKKFLLVISFTLPFALCSHAQTDVINIIPSGNVGISATAPVSALEVAGSYGQKVTTITGNLTLDVTHNTIVCNNGGTAIIVTLPAANTCAGRVYVIKRNAASTNTVTIAGAPTIDGAASFVLTTANQVIEVFSDGAEWKSRVGGLSGLSNLTAGNDIDFGTSSGNSIDLEPTLNFVHTVSAPASNNLNLNAASGFATVVNFNNGTTGANQTFRIGNGAGSDVFYVFADGQAYTTNWWRSLGNTGWYNQTYGGGWFMNDGNHIKSYGDKSVYITGDAATLRMDGLKTTGSYFSAAGANTSLVYANNSTGDFYSMPAVNNATLVTNASGVPSWQASTGTGVQGYWTRSGTNLYNTNQGDNVGIGTTAPNSQLDVRTTTAGNFPVVRINNDAASGETGIRFRTQSSGALNAHSDISWTATGNETGNLVFRVPYTNERMRIQSDGNVGIGSANPLARLEVTGSSQVRTSILTDGYAEDVSGIIQGNYVPSQKWNLGTGGVGIFNQNGATTENTREWGDGPHGNRAILWKGYGYGNDADGGWNTSLFKIDHTKTYRVSIWVKKTGANSGTTYFGCYGDDSNIMHLNGTVQTNPYFYCGTLPQLDRWYLIVGYIHGSGDASTIHAGGVYDGVTGEKVVNLNGNSNCSSDYKFTTSATEQRQRAYLYYNTNSACNQFFWGPRFEEVNGKEPSVAALLGLSTYASGNYIQNQTSANQSAGFRITGNGLFNGGNIGVGTLLPQKRIDALVPANDFVTVGAATLGIGQWAGLHFGYREDNTLYRKSAIVFERTDNSGGGGNAGGKMHFLNGPATGSGSATLADSRMTVGELGNVGIGSTSPDAKLRVSGGGQILGTNGTSSNTRTLTILNEGQSQINFGSYPGAWTSALQIQNNDNTDYIWISPLQDGNNAIFLANGSGLDFRVGANATAATITETGNVGIGTTAPTQKLTVSGNVNKSSSWILGDGVWGANNLEIHTNSWDGSSNANWGGLIGGHMYAYAGIDIGTGSGTEAGGGQLVAANDIKSPIYYDRDDVSYYINPNGNSIINTVRVAGGSPAAGKVLTSTDGAGNATWQYPTNSWEYVGNDARVVCNGGAADLVYEWGVTYNNQGTILRVTCNTWNVGYRVCSYPPYPTGDSEPFRWGGVCFIWNTNSTWDDACSRYYHSYYYQTDAGKYEMWGGNGCDQNPGVYRRKL